MLNIRRILLPTDFSDCSNQALIHAVKLAQEHGAELHLLHAIVLYESDPENPTYVFPEASEFQRVLEESAGERMGALVRDSDLPDLVVRQVYRRDVSAASAIVEYAQEEDIDLIVMGTHGRRGVRKLLLGSVATEVARMAPCAVMTVRGEGGKAPPQPVRRVLAPVDFSEPAEEALAVACTMASTYGAELQLVHVLHEVLHPTFYDMGVTRISDLGEDILRNTESALRDLHTNVGGCHGTTATCFALEGHPASEIVQFSQDHGSDLIVMSTHGLTGVKHFLMGSTAEKVLAGAECPVLIVKATGRSLLSQG